jgi:hypothetical protein
VFFKIKDGPKMKYETLKLDNNEENQSSSCLGKLVAIKDRYRISDKAYHELRMLFKSEMPSLLQVKREQARQSTTVDITQTPAQVLKTNENFNM